MMHTTPHTLTKKGGAQSDGAVPNLATANKESDNDNLLSLLESLDEYKAVFLLGDVKDVYHAVVFSSSSLAGE